MNNQPEGSNPEQKNFEQLFEEMNDLLHQVIEKIESPEVSEGSKMLPPDLGKMFAELERDVNIFTETNKKIVESSFAAGGVSIPKEPLTKREQKSLDRSQELIKKAEKIQEQNPVEPIPRGDISDTEKDRKKHLKRIRRGQTWKL